MPKPYMPESDSEALGVVASDLGLSAWTISTGEAWRGSSMARLVVCPLPTSMSLKRRDVRLPSWGELLVARHANQLPKARHRPAPMGGDSDRMPDAPGVPLRVTARLQHPFLVRGCREACKIDATVRATKPTHGP